MIEVSEIYHAPQGEGKYLGRQALFVRVRRCPLACDWCDTRYTWDKNDPGYAEFASYTPSDLVGEMIEQAYRYNWAPMSVVFTGGEPMIYQRELVEVIDLFRKEFRVLPVEVETSGIIAPTPEMIARCHFNVSQKLPSAGNKCVPLDKLLNPEITRLFAITPATFKVVVANEDGDRALESYLTWLREVTRPVVHWNALRQRVYLMPEGTTEERISLCQGRIIQLAQEHGVCVTTRMQVIAFDNRRRT